MVDPAGRAEVARPLRRSLGDAGDLAGLDARRADVQTARGAVTKARTFWMFGFQRRLFRLWEKVTALPKNGFFPQTSHTAAIG